MGGRIAKPPHSPKQVRVLNIVRSPNQISANLFGGRWALSINFPLPINSGSEFGQTFALFHTHFINPFRQTVFPSTNPTPTLIPQAPMHLPIPKLLVVDKDNHKEQHVETLNQAQIDIYAHKDTHTALRCDVFAHIAHCLSGSIRKPLS